MEDKHFKQGDFLKKKNKIGSFMIYEGNNISKNAYKKMTLVCEYDPEKYTATSMGYDRKPFLDVKCETTIDTETEDYWIGICNEEEKETAKNILKEHGYEWDENNLALINMETKETVRKIKTPDNKYYGQIIKPISNSFKDILKQFCKNKNIYTYTPSYQNGYYYD